MAPNPNEGMAGAIIVRRSDAQIKTLEDLKGKSAAVTRKDAFMNAQTALGEISARGWDPDNFFSRIEEVGRPMERVVEAVATGRVDAGLVKAGLMELMLAVGSPFAKEIRVLRTAFRRQYEIPPYFQRLPWLDSHRLRRTAS